jgi:hypothetical protein
MLRNLEQILIGAPLLIVVCTAASSARASIITDWPSIHTNQDNFPPTLWKHPKIKKTDPPTIFKAPDKPDREDPPDTDHTNQDRIDGERDYGPPADERDRKERFVSPFDNQFGDPQRSSLPKGDFDWLYVPRINEPGGLLPSLTIDEGLKPLPQFDHDVAATSRLTLLRDTGFADFDLDRRTLAPSIPVGSTVPAPGALVLLGVGAFTLASGRRRRGPAAA